MSGDGPALRRARLRFGVLCVLGYVTLSWAVRYDMRRGEQIASLFYPLDTFSMYAGTPGQLMSHLLVRDAEGNIHRITDFRAFACDTAVAPAAARCAQNHAIQYHYDDLTNYIDSHHAPGSLDVELVSRTWQVRSGAPPIQTPDCIVAHCKVAR